MRGKARSGGPGNADRLHIGTCLAAHLHPPRIIIAHAIGPVSEDGPPRTHGSGSIGSAGGGSGGSWPPIAGSGSSGSAGGGCFEGSWAGGHGFGVERLRMAAVRMVVTAAGRSAGWRDAARRGLRLAGGVARVGDRRYGRWFLIAVVGVRNASRTPDITTAAAAPTNAITAGLVRYHGRARMATIQGATTRPPNMSSARGGACRRAVAPCEEWAASTWPPPRACSAARPVADVSSVDRCADIVAA